MQGLFTPRPLQMVASYPDGDETRHFTFQLEDPSVAGEVAPGQFFLLTVPRAGEAAFTYVSLPDSCGRFDALVRRIGSVTSALFAAESEAVLGYRGPFGRGWPLDTIQGQPVLVVAGGCGLATVAAAVSALSQAADTPVALVYGSRQESGQMLARERAVWQQRMSVVETFDQPKDPSHVQGTVVEHLDRGLEQLAAPAPAALLCGPEVMMTAVALALVQRGLDEQRIWLSLERRMHCGVGLCGHCYLGSTYVCQHGPTYRWAELALGAG